MKLFSNRCVRILALLRKACLNNTMLTKGRKYNVKKAYVKPVIDEMSIKATAAGGSKPSTHDGYIYETNVNGQVVAVEEYYPASGEN